MPPRTTRSSTGRAGQVEGLTGKTCLIPVGDMIELEDDDIFFTGQVLGRKPGRGNNIWVRCGHDEELYWWPIKTVEEWIKMAEEARDMDRATEVGGGLLFVPTKGSDRVPPQVIIGGDDEDDLEDDDNEDDEEEDEEAEEEEEEEEEDAEDDQQPDGMDATVVGEPVPVFPFPYPRGLGHDTWCGILAFLLGTALMASLSYSLYLVQANQQLKSMKNEL